MKYREWLEDWLNIYIRPYVKSRTMLQYSNIIYKRLDPELGDMEMSEITPLTIQKYIAELSTSGNLKTGGGLMPNTVYGVLSVIRNSLSAAETHGIIEDFHCDKIKRPRKLEKKVDCFTVEEQKKIERAVLDDRRDKMFGVILSLYTGLRIGEVLALEWSDIDFNKGELQVSKTCYDGVLTDGGYGRIIDTPKTESSCRTVPLPTCILPCLQRLKYRSRSSYVVSNGEKAPTIRTYQYNFERMLQKLNIPHRGFHALRHTFATRALECGIDVKTLSEILGHRSPTVTLNRYVHSLTDHKKEMMNRLGGLFLR